MDARRVQRALGLGRRVLAQLQVLPQEVGRGPGLGGAAGGRDEDNVVGG